MRRFQIEIINALLLFLVASVNSLPDSEPCEMPDGQAGVCVRYYLCNTNNTVITDGTNLIDIRIQDGPCKSYMDTCCLAPDTRPATDPLKPVQEPKREGCGWANPKGADLRTTGETVGETKFGEFPWMVAVLKSSPLFQNDPEGMKIDAYVGGGSLIHPSAVLTAAYNIHNGGDYKARAGEWDFQNTKEIYPYQDRNVDSIAAHKDFNKGNLFYNIAILFLERPMDLAPNVGVACLPPPSERTHADTRCFATGWGTDKFGKDGQFQVILKKVNVPVVERSTCQTVLRGTRLGRFFELHKSFMCAGGENGVIIRVCKGDGGSPLSCPISSIHDRYMQSGIVAWSIGCGDNGTPGVYVDVSHLRDWIDETMTNKGFETTTYTF